MSTEKRNNNERKVSVKMVKKLFGVILGLSVAASVLQVPVSAEEQKGYYWLEAEDAVCSEEYITIDNDKASGGKLVGVCETKDGEYSVEFSFDNSKTEKYDIWFLSGKGSTRKASKFKWSLNSSEASSVATADSERLYSEKMNKALCDIQWNKISGGISLSQGENKIKFIVNEKTDNKIVNNERAYFNMIDAAVIVPTSWKWSPDGLSEPVKPEKIDADFAWIELESPDTQDKLFEIKDNQSASEGKVLYADRIDSKGDELSHTLGYSFDIDKTKSYDIWYLGFQSNVAHLSGLQWEIDNPNPETPHGVTKSEDDLTCFNESVAGSNFPLYWQKMTTKNIGTGTHTLYLKFVSSSMQGNKYLFAADCVIIVPSELGWTPNELNLEPSAAHGEIAAKLFMNQHADFFSKDFSNITENLSLPDTKFVNQLGAKIYYSADQYDGREVISADGTVTRPYATAADDAKINFYINAEYTDSNNNIKVGRVAIPMTVKKWNKYEIIKPLETDKTKLAAGETITANADVNIHTGGANSGKATILMVLYDAAGKMQKISMGEQSGTGEVSVSAQMTMPENVTDSKLKVFLLNGLANGNRLTDTLTIDG